MSWHKEDLLGVVKLKNGKIKIKMAFIHISKLDAAKRQLETAINLFFRESDPVSIHTLTYAAHEILSVIAKTQNIPTILKNNPIIKPEMEDEFLGLVAKAANFFKHSKKDSKETLEFNPETNDYYLLDAVEVYILLTGEKTPAMMTYRTWFLLKNPKFLNFNSEDGKKFAAVSAIFNPSNKPKFFDLINEFSRIEKIRHGS